MKIKQIAIDEALELHKRGLMARWFGIIGKLKFKGDSL